MKIEDFNKLDFPGFVGYYWYSNAESPKFELKTLSKNEIPFVIEGFLYDSTSNKSISIKNYNAEYVITDFVIKDNNKIRFLPEQKYPAYKLDGIKSVKFRELQELKKADENFEVWQTVAKVFVGFEKY